MSTIMSSSASPLASFLHSRTPQLTATTLLITYALLRKKLTPLGTLSGALIATTHLLHPWPSFFWLLMIFFLLGTFVTRIGHAHKASLTQSSTGGTGGEGPRTSAQVFANSGWAALLILAHAYLLQVTPFISSNVALPGWAGPHVPVLLDLLPIGIIAQYAAVAADTFSSELGILSQEQPFLITAPWRTVPKGTNGGVTVEGLIYGQMGSLLLVLTAFGTLWVWEPFVVVEFPRDVLVGALLTYAGVGGSVIDSVLGATLQATVTDKGSGKVVEGPGGQRVKVLKGGSRVQLGFDVLTNNGVNFAMAAITSVLAMYVSWLFGIRFAFEHTRVA